MFDSFKSNKTKSLEILKKNHTNFKERTKVFTYSLNPTLLNFYLFEISNFLYSCQGLKNYYLSNTSKYNFTLQLETIIFVAKLSDILLSKIEYEHFHYSKFLNFVFRKTYGGEIKYYHIKLTRMIVDQQILPEIYDSTSTTTLINQFHNRTEQLTNDNDWNHIINSTFEDELNKVINFLESTEEKIIKISSAEIFDEFDTHDDDLYSRYLINNTESAYSPYIFLNGILSGLNDVIDSFLLKKLDIKLSDIDQDYYKEITETSYMFTSDNMLRSDNLMLQIFRLKVEEAMILKDGKYQKSKLHLNNNVIIITGVKIGNYLNELVLNYNLKKNLKYLL